MVIKGSLRRYWLIGLMVSLTAACNDEGGRKELLSSDASVRGDSTKKEIDLSCDHASYPSAVWTVCEEQNFARIFEAPAEQAASPDYMRRMLSQTVSNQEALTLRYLNDPSWLLLSNSSTDGILESAFSNPAELGSSLEVAINELQSEPTTGVPLNAPLLPLCQTYGIPCAGDPFRYPEFNGPDGLAFYTQEADVSDFVYYDDGCARITGRVWAPVGSANGPKLPAVVIENGSIQASQTLYWYAAQLLVRNGYVVMTFDPRGQGRSDWQTPTGVQGGNINVGVFVTGLINAIDFFRSTPVKNYPWNEACAGSYPTEVVNYNPYFNRIDPDRLGIAGHSAGAGGVSIVQGLDADGAEKWFGTMDASNPVSVAVAWDWLSVGRGNAAIDEGFEAIPRVPALSLMSEYMSPAAEATPADPATTTAPYTSPPDPEAHKTPFKAYADADIPVAAITIAGSTHFDFSLLTAFPATSWCPNAASGSCNGGWANAAIQHYTLAWFDRWLKIPGEPGYESADARMLDDGGPNGREKMSWHFYSARKFPLRNGEVAYCENIRSDLTCQ